MQKRLPISVAEVRVLRARKLLEGRMPNLHVSAQIAKLLGDQAQYILDKGFEKDFYLVWVLKRLRTEPCKRADLERVLLSKLPEILDAEQKRNKVKNLLAGMSRHLLITADGKRGPTAIWRLLPAGVDKLATEGKG